MSTLIELCFEDLQAAPDSPEYLQCVARPAGMPGLSVDRDGKVLWESPRDEAFALWVSLDDQLVLLRAAGAPEVVVSRAGRSVSAPVGKPIILLDQDFVQLGVRQWRMHVHGVASKAHAPFPLFRKAFATLAAAAALAACNPSSHVAGADAGSAVEVAKQPRAIEVRQHPPGVARPEDEDRIPQAPPPDASQR